MDYAGLTAAVGGFLNRGDLFGVIPTFVALCESEVNRELRSRRMIGRDTATISTEFVVLPTDFLEAISVTLDDDDETALVGYSPDGLARRKADSATQTGTPDSYSIVGGTFQFFPAPDAATDVILSYYKSLSALSSSNTSNWLLNDFPDIYLYGTLKHAAAYLAPDPRLATWAAMFGAAMAKAADEGAASQSGASLTPTSPYIV